MTSSHVGLCAGVHVRKWARNVSGAGVAPSFVSSLPLVAVRQRTASPPTTSSTNGIERKTTMTEPEPERVDRYAAADARRQLQQLDLHATAYRLVGGQVRSICTRTPPPTRTCRWRSSYFPRRSAAPALRDRAGWTCRPRHTRPHHSPATSCSDYSPRREGVIRHDRT